MGTFASKRLPVAVGLALAVTGGSALAGGFGIGTQSGSGTGNAFSGGAAAEDASTLWYNAAGITLLPKGVSIALAGHALLPSAKFSNTGSTGAFALPGTGEGGDAGDLALVPQAYLSYNSGSQWSIGLGISTPFGLKTEYDNGWRGALTALKSEVKSVNLQPTVAYAVSPAFSIAGGINYQHIEAELSNFTGAAATGNATVKGKDNAWGWNIGAMFSPSQSTRIGLHYRSAISYTLSGNVAFSGPAAAVANGAVTADLKVPESYSINVFHALNPTWELMGDITYTGWSSVQALRIVRTSGVQLSNQPFNWRDTWRVSGGANYKLSNGVKLRFGLAYDQTPTNDVDRTPRLPDQDRTWVALGAQFSLGKDGKIDVGYAHEFIRTPTVRNAVPPAPGQLVGDFSTNVNILSVQYSRSF